MTIKSFLKLVEIQTKVASVIPFLSGTLYAVYRFNTFHNANFVFLFASLLCIDMATTAINNYMDYKRANKKHGFGYESHNAIPRYNLRESDVVAVILILLGAAITFGIILFLNSGFVVLILGALSFATGILYSFGPVPISRTPFGELFSGLFMGIVIPFIAVYIHIFDKGLIDLNLHGGIVTLNFNALEMLYIILLSMPAATGIANIMLANNICDIEDDIENKRYTLPIYIGRDAALKVFRSLYYIGYLSLAILLILRAAPPIVALSMATVFPVERNIRAFYKTQTKKDTFVLAVKNFAVFNFAIALTVLIAITLKLN